MESLASTRPSSWRMYAGNLTTGMARAYNLAGQLAVLRSFDGQPKQLADRLHASDQIVRLLGARGEHPSPPQGGWPCALFPPPRDPRLAHGQPGAAGRSPDDELDAQ